MGTAMATLLQTCEPLNHNDRMKYLVKLGRTALADSSPSRDLIATLSSSNNDGSFYTQFLALQTSYGTRDTALALRALTTSPSRMLQKRALTCIITIGTKSEILPALQSLPTYLRIQGVKLLSRRKRLDVIDEFLRFLQDEVGEFYENLLWAASPEFLKEALPDVLDQISGMNVRRLVHHRARVVYEVVRDLIPESDSPEESGRLNFMHLVSTFLRETFARDQDLRIWDLVLDVVKKLTRLRPTFFLSSLPLKELQDRRPSEVATLVIERQEKNVVFPEKALHKLSVEQLLALQQLNDQTVTPSKFSSLTNPQRLAIFVLMKPKWLTPTDVLPDPILQHLPPTEQKAEARRHIGLPAFETSPEGTIPYAALLPYPEAAPLIAPFLGAPDAQTRAQALRSLIKCAAAGGFSPSDVVAAAANGCLQSALKVMASKRKEQDPVRRSGLLALAEVMPRCCRVEHLEPLEGIIRDALDAADLSRFSVEVLLDLVVGILPWYSEWAVRQFVLIVSERRQCPAQRVVVSRSPKTKIGKVMADLDRELGPLVVKLERVGGTVGTERAELIVGIAETWRDYLEYLPSLRQAIEKTLQRTTSASIAERILNLFLIPRDPQRLPEISHTLLGSDPGWIVFPLIEERVERNISQFDAATLQKLDGVKIGRFGKVRIQKAEKSWTVRESWRTTQRQQEEELEKMMAVVGNENLGVPERQMGVQSISSLIYVDFNFLINLTTSSSTSSKKVPIPVRDTAIHSLPSLDAGQGLPTLRQLLRGPNNPNSKLDPNFKSSYEGDLTRVAIYCVRPLLKCISKDEALDMLREVSMTRVAVAKEVIRIARDMKTTESWALLRELAADAAAATQKNKNEDDPRDEAITAPAGNKDDKKPTSPPLHRDVLIALLIALATDIYSPETYSFFMLNVKPTTTTVKPAQHALHTRQTQTQKPDTAIPLAILTCVPYSHPLAPQWLHLLSHILTHPSPRVRIAALHRYSNGYTSPISSPGLDPDKILVPALMALLDSDEDGEEDSPRKREERREAAKAMVRIYAAREPVLVGGLFERFLMQKEGGQGKGEGIRNRAMLLCLLGAYTSLLMIAEVVEGMLPTTEVILSLFMGGSPVSASSSSKSPPPTTTLHPSTTPPSTSPIGDTTIPPTKTITTTHLLLPLIFHSLPQRLLLPTLHSLIPTLHFDALTRAEALTAKLANRKGFDMDSIEKELGSSEHANVRRLGLVALVSTAKGKDGWETKERRERLWRYREDGEVLVREAAQWVLLPEEEL